MELFLQSAALNSYARRCLIHFITSGMFIRVTKPFLPESEIIGEIALKTACWHGQRVSTGDRQVRIANLAYSTNF